MMGACCAALEMHAHYRRGVRRLRGGAFPRPETTNANGGNQGAGGEAIMKQRWTTRRIAGSIASAVLMLAALIAAPTGARADEGGVSFWVPGFFGSLAATPLQPGFSAVNIYYHTSVSAGADVAFAPQV